jgi:hypothetical protein
MKMFKIFLRISAIVALLGLSNAATADIRNESAKPLLFPVDTGDGSAPTELSFDDTSGEEAQTTCAMTPNGNSPNPLLEEPTAPPPAPENLTGYNPDVTVAPLSALPPPVNRRGSSGRDYYPPPPGDEGLDPPPSPPTVPEPATMLIVGLGILGAASMRRRGKKN